VTSLRTAVLSLVFVAAGALPVRAADPPPLEALVAEALAQGPDVKAAAEALAAARSRPAQARALPDPVVSVLYVNDGWSPSLGEMPMTTLGLMGSQALPWPGKRDLRERIAVRDADVLAERLERERLTVAAGVRRAFWGLVLARETLALLREQEAIATEAEGVARARYAVGQGAQQEVLRAQVEITRFEPLRAAQEAEVETRLAELARLVGREVEAGVVEGASLELRPEPRELAALVAEAEATLPELRAGAALVERGRLAVDLASRDFKPDFSVQAGYMNRGGLDPMWQAGVGVSLPVQRGRRHAAVAEAEAGRSAAAAQVDTTRARIRLRTRERVAQLRAAERMVAVYAGGLLPQAELTYEAALASYQSGQVPFLAVLEALSGWYRDRLEHRRLLAAHERVKVALAEASLEATTEMPSGGATGMGPAASPAPPAMSGMGN
jgi:outer membrane protein TolC